MTCAYMVVRRKKGSRTNQHSCGKEGLFNSLRTAKKRAKLEKENNPSYNVQIWKLDIYRIIEMC